jgi:hypothetical protein
VTGAFAAASWSAALLCRFTRGFQANQRFIKTAMRSEVTTRATLRFEVIAVDDILVGSDDG